MFALLFGGWAGGVRHVLRTCMHVCTQGGAAEGAVLRAEGALPIPTRCITPTCLSQEHVELAGHSAGHGVDAKPAEDGGRRDEDREGGRASVTVRLSGGENALPPLCQQSSWYAGEGTANPHNLQVSPTPHPTHNVLMQCRPPPPHPQNKNQHSLDFDALLAQPPHQVCD